MRQHEQAGSAQETRENLPLTERRVNPRLLPTILLNYWPACRSAPNPPGDRGFSARFGHPYPRHFHDVVVHHGTEGLLPQLGQLIAHAGGFFEFQIAGVLQHLLLQQGDALAQLLLRQLLDGRRLQLLLVVAPRLLGVDAVDHVLDALVDAARDDAVCLIEVELLAAPPLCLAHG
eukprot:Opistho-2@43483